MSGRRLTIKVEGGHLDVCSVLASLLNLPKRFLSLKV